MFVLAIIQNHPFLFN